MVRFLSGFQGQRATLIINGAEGNAHDHCDVQLIQANEQTMSMRFTLVDSYGTISFSAPGHILKMLAASVRPDESTCRQLLDRLQELDRHVCDAVRNGLATFDEHCVRDQPETVAAWASHAERLTELPFRVLDPVTRNASLNPERLGLVILNLNEQRIVQVQNSYGRLLRCDRGRIRKEGRPTSRFYRYDLPAEWSIVP